ncbi:uncharacterized protein LOC129728320 [Wyeomyia smithii]|uniref:uncharacterized protein LOC129728320 n=1 Tax=Wyeomyia smithii TaxID=174621 RepID=UPI002467EB0A|nr:uncharacterized protein LOC129728320 [Wyeomyia smithii]
MKGVPILTSQATTKQQRAIERVAAEHVTVKTPLTKEELQQAETILWRQVQWDSFPDEMSALSNNLKLDPGQPIEEVKKSSRIYKCSPVLDDEGVLRMDGRLANAGEISSDKKHPIILCRSHGITAKLIQHYHEEFGHENSETVFNEMRQRFQIPKLRSAIQRVVRVCVWCRVNRCQPRIPIMAPLPVEPLTSHLRSFSSVGIDYLGPLEVTVGRRKEKSLTTESCRMAINGFQRKFGKPAHIFSDNATCFRGANNEMMRMEKINHKSAEKIVSPTTAWHFNPPSTPHMGGIWERMVRSVKEAMAALDDGQKLTDEILVMALAKIADMINTRPLTYLPQDAGETEALTPNHFLRGMVTGADLEGNDESTNQAEVLRNVYKRSQYLADKMWERWRKEYLPMVNQRTKWFGEQKPIKKGDLVFVVDGKNRKGWKIGIVEATVKGSDGRIRQADMRYADGSILRRGVVNLAVLDIRRKAKISLHVTSLSKGKYNVKNTALVDSQTILMPPLHIKLGLIKRFVKALGAESPALQYLQQKFLRLTTGMVTAGIFTGPLIRTMLYDKGFSETLNEMENHTWEKTQVHDSQKMNCRVSLKLHILKTHLDKFKDIIGTYSEEHGERFHPDMLGLKKALYIEEF